MVRIVNDDLVLYLTPRRCRSTERWKQGPANKGHKRILKAELRLTLLLAMQVLVFTGTSHAEDQQSSAPTQQQVQAKMRYCEVCHGANGQGFPGYYPIPRLAGRPPEYIEDQLKAFSENKRKFIIMVQVSHSLSPAMLTALATNFSKLNPKPVDRAPQKDVSAGKEIYEGGIANASVPPCAACHGSQGKGNGQFPRLAGQLYPYVVRAGGGKIDNHGTDRTQPKRVTNRSSRRLRQQSGVSFI